MEVRLLVLAKAPVRGRVKTRLAASLGQDFALAAYEALVGGVLVAAAASGLPTTIHYSPAEARAAMGRLCGQAATLVPQAAGDLGARMAAAFDRAFAAGAAGAVLVGSDLPLLDGALLARAGAMLAERDAVLGPALDGGYYAVGFSRAGYCPGIFTEMTWSRPDVCAVTRQRLEAAGRRLGLLPALPDCDTAEDLRLLRAEPWRSRLAGTPFGRFLEGTAGDPFDRDPDYRLSVP